MSKLPKTREEWIAAALHQWWIKVAVGVLTLCTGWILAQGKGMVEKKILGTVQPAIDSIQHQVDTLKNEMKMQRDEQRQFFGAMMDAMPAVKEAVKKRGEQNQEAEKKKQESDTLLKNLTGDPK